MNTRSRRTARWATSAFGDSPLPSLAELTALKTQLDECRRASGRFFSMRCTLEALNGKLANRTVTMFVVVILFLGVVSLVY